MQRITKKQMEIYEYIQQTTREQGYPPSVREIGAAVGLRSPSTVHAHLKALEDAGLINREDHKTRAIRVAGPTQPAPLRDGWQMVPIIGHAAAGSPILAVEDIDGYLPFEVGHSGGDFFALRIKGDSMVDAGISDGDTVVIRRQEDAQHGEIIVAAIEGEVTVKRLYRQRGEVWLMPENPAYRPISAENAHVVGKVIGLYRKF